MPRPRRAQGRPGTPVIPADWETSHAPVVSKTMTTPCVIRNAQPGTPAFDVALGHSVRPAGFVLYTGNSRVQVLNAQDAGARIGEQDQQTAAYLVVIDREAANIPLGATIEFPTATDPTLLGNRRLVVRKTARGSLRFERDLYCVDDMTRKE